MVHFTRQLRTVHFTGLLPVAIYLVSRDVARLCEAKFNSMLLLLPLLLGLRWHHLILQQRFWLLFSKEDKGWTFLHRFAAFTPFCMISSDGGQVSDLLISPSQHCVGQALAEMEESR